MSTEAQMQPQEAAPATAEAAAPEKSREVITLIPRINIHIFCEAESTAQVMQLAAADRRLANAHCNIHLGGVPGAIQTYSGAQTPDLLIIESTKSRDGIMNDLAHLANVCDPTTKVVVIGPVNDIILFRELISQGISDYLFTPLHQLQIVEAIGKLYHDPEAEPIGKVIAFTGAKGGVGSSMLAHNVAWAISEPLDTDTIVVDLDLAYGTSGLNFNSALGMGFLDALGSHDRIDESVIDRLLTKCSEKLSLLAAPGVIDREYSIEAEAVDMVIEVVRKSVPSVIVDVPNIWAPWSKQILEGADQIVITATPDLASLRNSKNLIDHLKSLRKNDADPCLVLNQVGIQKRPEIAVADFAKAVDLTPACIIPFEAKLFGTASSNGQMVSQVEANSKPAEAIHQLAMMLIGRIEPPKKKAKGFSLPFMAKLGKRKDSK